MANTWTLLLKENGISNPKDLIGDAILENRRREGVEFEYFNRMSFKRLVSKRNEL